MGDDKLGQNKQTNKSKRKGNLKGTSRDSDTDTQPVTRTNDERHGHTIRDTDTTIDHLRHVKCVGISFIPALSGGDGYPLPSSRRPSQSSHHLFPRRLSCRSSSSTSISSSISSCSQRRRIGSGLQLRSSLERVEPSDAGSRNLTTSTVFTKY